MTRISTACPSCGRVQLDVDDVTLVVSPREDTAWYLFDCRGCVRRVVKPAPATVAVALGEVRVAVWTVPAEMLERVRPDEAPAIDADDLLDVILDLRRVEEHGPGQVVEQAAGEVIELPGARTPSPGAAGSRPARPNAV